MIGPTCRSPVELASLASVELPSPAIETILSAIYATAPTKERARQWKTLSKMKWPTTRPRRVAACIGRRGLKTSGILAWSAVYEAIFGGHEEHALAGSRIYACVVAPKLAQAREAVRAIRSVLDSLAGIGVRYETRDANGNPEIVITEPAARAERVITVEVCDDVSVRSRAIFFLGADEAGRWPSEEWLASRDEDVVRAARGAMAQFPNALEVYTSNPGRPGSVFHRLVTKPTEGTLVLTAATWTTNPRITRERCWQDSDGVRETFEIEYEATRWGQTGGSFLDSGAVWSCLGSEHAGKGPRPGAFVVGFDHGQLKDAAAIVVVSAFDLEIGGSTSPVRHVVVEHCEAIPSSKKNPIPTAALVGRLVAVARSYDSAPILFDMHAAVDVADALKKYGYRPFDERAGERGERLPHRRSFLQASMAPQHQHPRWMLLQAIVAGRRLHLGHDGEALAKELVGLTATMQSAGTLKVEGRGSSPDNLVDALALTLPYAALLAPTDGPGGSVRFVHDGAMVDGEGLTLVRPRWVRDVPGGGIAPAEVPRWHPSFEEYAQDAIARGISTPAIEAWRTEQRTKPRAGTVPVLDF
jgi:hypothetical protein